MMALVGEATKKFSDVKKGDVLKEFISFDKHGIHDPGDGPWEGYWI